MYIGSQFWNEGRTNEIAERYEHLSDINDEGDKNNEVCKHTET